MRALNKLNKLYYIKLDIESIKEEIMSLPIINSQQITGLPHGSGGGSPIESYCLRKEKLLEKLNQRIERYSEELVKIEDIIDRIDDIEVKAIARMRFILNMRWEDIGEKVHLERTTCSKKLRKHLESMDI